MLFMQGHNAVRSEKLEIELTSKPELLGDGVTGALPFTKPKRVPCLRGKKAGAPFIEGCMLSGAHVSAELIWICGNKAPFCSIVMMKGPRNCQRASCAIQTAESA